ncbi:MAG: phage tail protein [Ectothiorhodospiraceae bacterium]|nr:phage tail protein [Ectothiorhodospiraceae bacterium]
MAQPYVGEIRMFAGNFAPLGWRFCDGQLLPIIENEVLFQLIGTTYGGDGESTFALPDLRGRAPIHQGNGRVMGEHGGQEYVSLTAAQVPAHDHALVVGSPQVAAPGAQRSSNPVGAVALAATTRSFPYREAHQVNAGTQSGTLAADAVVFGGQQQSGEVGAGDPHENRPPYLVVGFIISLYGLFPSPT